MKKYKLATTMVVLIIVSMTSYVLADLPNPGMTVVKGQTALVITDPQNDFLSPNGVTWGVVGKSVSENNTVENIENLFKAAKASSTPIFISLSQEKSRSSVSYPLCSKRIDSPL